MIETLNIRRSTRRDFFLTEEFKQKNGKEFAEEMIKKFVEQRPPLEIKYTDALYFYHPNSTNAFEIPRDEPYAVNLALMNTKQLTPESFFVIDERQISYLATDFYAVAFLTSPTSSKISPKKEFICTNNYLFPNKERLIIYQ